VRRIRTTGRITGKTTRTIPEATGKDSDIETGAGGPLDPFPESLQRWTRYQSKDNDISGFYGLISVQDLLIAKMDAKIVKITEVSDAYA